MDTTPKSLVRWQKNINKIVQALPAGLIDYFKDQIQLPQLGLNILIMLPNKWSCSWCYRHLFSLYCATLGITNSAMIYKYVDDIVTGHSSTNWPKLKFSILLLPLYSKLNDLHSNVSNKTSGFEKCLQYPLLISLNLNTILFSTLTRLNILSLYFSSSIN